MSTTKNTINTSNDNLYDFLQEQESSLKQEIIEGMDQYVIGQDKAKNTLAQTIFEGVNNVYDDQWVLGAVFLAGPTGVGKTELVRSLANTLLGNPDAFVKIDGGLMIHPANISQLVGSSPWYVGYGHTPKLADTVVHSYYKEAKEKNTLHPILQNYGMENFAIILVDEVEKAHPDVTNAFLNVLQSGTMEMATGSENENDKWGKIKYSKTTDLRNALFVFTSNIGEKTIANSKKNAIGFTTNNNEDSRADDSIFQKELSQHFAPEFLGRLNIVRCHALTPEHLRAAMRRHVDRMNSVIEKKKYSPSTTVKVSDNYIDHVMKDAKSAEFGARAISGIVKNIGTQVGLILQSGKLENAKAWELYFDVIDNRPNIQFIETLTKNETPTILAANPDQILKNKTHILSQHVSNLLQGYMDILEIYDENFEEVLQEYITNLLSFWFTQEELKRIQISIYNKAYNDVIQPELYEEIIHSKDSFKEFGRKNMIKLIESCVNKDRSIPSIYMHIHNLMQRPLTQDEQIIVGQYIHRFILKKGK